MAKPISPRLHGLLDYGFLAVFAGVPRLLDLSPQVRAVFTGMGAAQTSLDAVTDQPYALRRRVPFRVHGLVEKASGPLYVAAPLAAGAWRDPRARAFLLAAGAALVTVHALTDWDARDTDA